MSNARIGILLLAWALQARAQGFEAASIHLSGPKSVRGSEGGPGHKDPARYVFDRATLLDLIVIAHDVEEFQVSSKLQLERDDFDLDARVPAGATKEEFQAMLRNFLVDRFHLRVRLETRDFDAFALVVAKTGPKLGGTALLKAAPGDGFPNLPAGRPGIANRNIPSGGYIVTRVRGQQEPVSVLAEFLRIGLDRPVVDTTGLDGRFNFTLEYARELPNGGANTGAPPEAPDLSTALREQLGLQLVAKKLPFRVIAVDAVDRLPAGN